ncbi:serine O-acetyltransferase [Argonema galeatum]|uniref:serine O-acetyltransferase n=1 Tax=Argonema galeatum TaxID=2942762 RepID=UPI002011E3B3|nr:serine acetyltransferase [Argonema galeatum A003/A1]
MKNFINNIFLIGEQILMCPQLLLFYLSSEKEVIVADVKRWVEIFQWKSTSDLSNLLSLTAKKQEFRNLYYYRIAKGNFAARLVMRIINIFYKECPYLFLDLSSNIGPGLFIQHGFSTIIMADIGENCWINQQVSIGYKDKTGRPKIGDNVRITAGAKVLGNITVGNNVTVGANAVVIKNVPDNCVVVGVPAYIVKKNGLKVKEELV